MGVGCGEANKCYATSAGQPELCPTVIARDELRDEIWDALMNRMDIDVSTTSLADAVLERLEAIGVLCDSDATRRAETACRARVPKHSQARAGGIAQTADPKPHPRYPND
jgi:hypothetical protein